MRVARAAFTSMAMVTALGVVAPTAASAAPSAASASSAPVAGANPAISAARTIAYQPIIPATDGGKVTGAATPKAPKPPKIEYHGGAVMAAPAGNKVYLIWYGTWPDSAAKSLVSTFVTDLSNSKYWAINNGYTNSAKKKVSKVLTLGGQATDDYSQGHTNLTTSSIAASVTAAIGSNALPKDEDGIYVVLTSSDVTVNGFKTNFCGWHTHTSVGGSNIKFSLVGDAGGASACTPQQTSPNGNARIDALLSVLAHELAETVTDPNLDAWYDSKGDENADKCAWDFGKTLTLGNGAKYNVTLNGTNYYLQQNWKKAGNCALK